MQELFGLSTDSIAWAIIFSLGITATLVTVGVLRNPIIAKMGVRNIGRRPAQTSLIVLGLMLSTVIISASLGIGDTVYSSIRNTALDSMGHIDEEITVTGGIPFSEEQIRIVTQTAEKTEVDGIIYRIDKRFPVINKANSRTESRMIIRGYQTPTTDQDSRSSLDGFPDYAYADVNICRRWNSHSCNFGSIKNLKGSVLSLESLEPYELYLNRSAASTLGAKEGDKLDVITNESRVEFTVAAVLREGGLASGGGRKVALTRYIDLAKILNREGEIDWIGISNTGGIEEGLVFSDEVTGALRLASINQTVGKQIFVSLQNSTALNILETKLIDPLITEEETESLSVIVSALEQSELSDQFLTTVADPAAFNHLMTTLSEDQSVEEGLSLRLGILWTQLNELEINPIKSNSLAIAERASTSVTTLFSIFGSFSIIVGLLLIFLVMVLLAASRKTEMGMARAIGMKRSHLMQMFVYEGSVYALISAFVGTVIGSLVGIALVGLLRQAIATPDFVIEYTFTFKSILIAFGGGFLLTVITVTASAYRVSRLNIVVAIRGLNEELASKAYVNWPTRGKRLLLSFILPIIALGNIFKQIRALQLSGMLIALIKVVLLPLTWPLLVIKNILSMFFTVVAQGWPLLIIGPLLVVTSIGADNGTGFNLGVSLVIIGLGLLLRKLLIFVQISKKKTTRIATTFEGLSLLIFWGLPFTLLEPLTGKLNTTPDIFVLGGVTMVASVVWVIMNNNEVLLWFANLTIGKITGIQAVLKTAIAYPVASTFRTGLTISMFGIVIFTLTIFAVLNNIQNVAREQPTRVTGGYDIKADTLFPINDFSQQVAASSLLDSKDFVVTAKSKNIQAIGREIDAKETQFKSLLIRSVDDNYLKTTQLQFSHYNPQYGSTPRDIWNSLLSDPSLAVASNSNLHSGDPFGPTNRGFQAEDRLPDAESQDWELLQLEILPEDKQLSGESLELTVIAVIDSVADSLDFQQPSYVITSDKQIKLQDLQEGRNSYFIKLQPGVNADDITPLMETVFLPYGLAATNTLSQIDAGLETQEAFNKLFQGFMSLGIVVGVVAIGVLSIRAVVERRKIIGTMRAIGYKSRMIAFSFLLEALFITLLGVIIGVGLGLLTASNIFREISREVEGVKFSIPVLNLAGIIFITSIAALISSFLPDRQASKIYPAEALRYE